MHNFKQGNLPFARGNYNVNLFAPFKALSTGQWGKLKWKQKLQLPRPGVPTCRSPFCCLERNCPEKHFPVVLMAVAPAHLSFECDVEICRCHRCSIACLLSRALSDIRAIWAMNRTAEYHPTTTPGCWHQDCGSSEIKVGLFPELMWHADTPCKLSVHTWRISPSEEIWETLTSSFTFQTQIPSWHRHPGCLMWMPGTEFRSQYKNSTCS